LFIQTPKGNPVGLQVVLLRSLVHGQQDKVGLCG
jgi:hypothetical protein